MKTMVINDEEYSDREYDYDEEEGERWQVGMDEIKDTVKDILYSVLYRHGKPKDKGQDSSSSDVL